MDKENDFRKEENWNAMLAAERERMQRISGFFYEIPDDLLKWLRENVGNTGYGEIGERIALPRDPYLRKELILKFSRANEAMIESRAPKKLLNTLEKTIRERELDTGKLEASGERTDNSMILELRRSTFDRIKKMNQRHIQDLNDIKQDMERRMMSEPFWLTLIQDIEVALRNAQLEVGTSAYEELLDRKEKRREEIIRD